MKQIISSLLTEVKNGECHDLIEELKKIRKERVELEPFIQEYKILPATLVGPFKEGKINQHASLIKKQEEIANEILELLNVKINLNEQLILFWNNLDITSFSIEKFVKSLNEEEKDLFFVFNHILLSISSESAVILANFLTKKLIKLNDVQLSNLARECIKYDGLNSVLGSDDELFDRLNAILARSVSN